MWSLTRIKWTPRKRRWSRSPFSFARRRKGFIQHSFLDLPAHLQRLILGNVPLRKLAQLACLNKELRAVYLERVNERDAVISALLESHFTAEFREGLSPAETALPRDLIVDPPMDNLLQAAPGKRLSVPKNWKKCEGQYQGFCMAGRPDGRGECKYSNGDTYMGDWRKGYYHGRGTQVYADGGIYVGDWHKGKRTHGTFTWATGDKYEGQFHKYLGRNGKGRLEWPNGDVYVGDFIYDSMYGKGRFEWANGHVYVGEWEIDKMHGEGRHEWPNGAVYVGKWVENGRHGKGRYESPDGALYVGKFKNNVRHGLGRETLASGESYFGDFKNDKRDGQGIMTYPDRRTYVGCWKEGEIVQGGGSFRDQ